METDEYLDVVVGDVGRLISGVFHLLEFMLGLIYLIGQTFAQWLFVSGTFIWEASIQTVEVLKLTGSELWDFGTGIIKGILLIYYGIWMVFESFYIISMDLKSFMVHVFVSVGQNFNDISTAIVNFTTRTFFLVPHHVCQSLIFIGEKTAHVFQAVFGIILDFLTQLVVAPFNAIQAIICLLVKVFNIPFYIYNVLDSIPITGKAGLVVVLALCVIYWKVNFLNIPRTSWRAVKRFWSVIVNVFSLMKNSKRIVQQVMRHQSNVNKKKEFSYQDTKALCVICQDQTVSFISIPCKHVCLCFTCVKALVDVDNRCPLCRSAVSKFERVYIPL